MLSVLLVLGTWLAWIITFVGLGLLVSSRFTSGQQQRDQLRAALWIGLAGMLALASAASLVSGLAPAWGGWVVAGLWLLGGSSCLVAWRRAGLDVGAVIETTFTLRRLPALIVLGLFGLGLVLAARFAAAEPMDYDAGLYRVGAINYAGAYPVVPGLGNLHARLGFNSSLWPFGALTGNGLWQGQGYRIVTGVFLTALVADIVLRILVPRSSGKRPGDWFMVIAGAYIGALILTDSGRWVPSPAQDVTTYVLAVASTAYLADFISTRSSGLTSDGNLSVVAGVAAATLRPLGWVIAAMTVVVVGLVSVHFARAGRVSIARHLRSFAPSLIFATGFLAIMLARDAFLTGWLMFPMKSFPIDVAWRTVDPTGTSRAITAWGRAPGLPADQVLADTQWVGPWLISFRSSREVYLLSLTALGVVAPALWSRGRSAWRASWAAIVLTSIPSVAYTAVWFVTAPDVRFAWAGLLALVAVPLAFLLAADAYPAMPLRIVGACVLVVMLGANVVNNRVFPRGGPPVEVAASFGPIPLTLHLTPPASVTTKPGKLADGTPIVYPVESERCWLVFPLCLLPGSGGDVKQLGANVSDGYALVSR